MRGTSSAGVPQLHGGPSPPVRAFDRSGRAPAGAFAEYVALPDDERVGAPLATSPDGGRDLRPLRQRRAHRPRVPGPSARTCSSPARARSASCRSPSPAMWARATSSSRDVEPTGSSSRGRWARRRRRRLARARPRRRAAELGMREGFDVGFEMSGRRRRSRDDREHEPRRSRSPCSACPPSRSRRLGQGGLSHAHAQGHLRARDVRDLELDERDARRAGLDVSPRSSATATRHATGARRSTSAASGGVGKVILDWTELCEHVRHGARPAAGGARRDRGGRAHKRERGIHGPQGVADRGRRRARCSTSAPTTTSASRTTRASSPPRTRRSTSGATAWRACASSAAPRSCTSTSSERVSEFLGTDDTILFSLLLRRERRRLRGALRRGRRDHLRRAQPRVDHRRHPALQGAAAPLREPRHGRPRGAARGGVRRPVPGDRDRRRLLDGRLHRPAATRSATWPSATTRSCSSTTRTPSASSVRMGGGRTRSTAASRAGSTSSPARSARRSAGQPGLRGRRQEIVDLLRQRARPYLFSNSSPPRRRRDLRRSS